MTRPASVRVGYKENEAIDTSGYGAFTQTSVTLKKAGAGMAFTEEFYMRQTTVDIQSLLLDKIALDFTKARYTRIVAKLAGNDKFGIYADQHLRPVAGQVTQQEICNPTTDHT